jgi:hypothetical protein
MATKRRRRRKSTGRIVTTTRPAPAARRTPAAARKPRSTFDLIPGTKVDEYVAPWILAYIAIPVIGLLAHLAWGHGAWQWTIPPLLVVGGAGLAVVAWLDAAARKPLIRIRVALSVLLALVSVAISTVTGIVSVRVAGHPARFAVDWVRPWMDIQLVLGGLLALSWNVLRTEAVRGLGDDAHPEPDQRDTLADRLGLPGMTAKVVAVDDTRRHLQLTHRGATVADVQRVAETIASEAGVPATGVRVTADPDDAGISNLVLVSRDLLRTPIPHPGPSRPGGSICEPSRIGLWEDGTVLELVRPGDDEIGRPSVSVGAQGMPGAGKTEGLLCEAAEWMTRRDVVIWWSDTIKAAQTAGSFRPAIDWLVDTVPGTKAMIAAVDPIIRARTEAMAAHGFRQWSPDVYEVLGIPYLVINLEESSRVMEPLGDMLTRAGEAVRSVGISFTVSMQRQSGTNISTDLRFLLGVGWCYGTHDEVDASMVLSDTTVDAGARPHSWKAYKPGYCYLEATHVSSDRWSMPARTYHLRDNQLRALTAEWAPRMARLDETSATAAGPAYARRQIVSVQQWIKETGPIVVPSQRRDETDDDQRDERDGDDGLAEDETEARALLPERDEEIRAAMEAANPRRDVPWDDDEQAKAVDFSAAITPGAEMSPAERDEQFAAIISRRLSGHPDGVVVTTEEMVDAWLDIPGMTPAQRPALSRRLRKLVDIGAADDLGRGRWRILPGAERHAGQFTDSDEDEGVDGAWSVAHAS